MSLFEPNSTFMSCITSRPLRSAARLALLLALAPALHAQLDKGAITGTLRDRAGAVITGATVKVMNTETGVTNLVNTNDDGTYQVLALNPGTYSVEATATGFGPAKNTSVEV